MPLIETKGAASAQGFGGAGAGASGPVTYIEDVFSTYLFKGTAVFPNRNTITTGIDSSKGELVWLKNRTAANNNFLFDTQRGNNNYLITDNTSQQTFDSSGVVFTSTGFTLGAPFAPTTGDMVSWNFREQPKFFDIVTYTGTGSVLNVAHSLGSIPGCIIIKRTDGGGTLWAVYHQSLGATKDIALNSTSGSGNSSLWNSTAPTSTQFTVGALSAVNANGGTYVAYIFAHNAGGFGLTGTDNVISCGSYTGNGSATGPTITLGYEPQWLMIKNASGTGNWNMIDNMRGMPVGSADAFLEANTSDAEATADWVSPTATGFNIVSTSSEVNTNTSTYIYIAIRRGPMKVPTSGTSVYTPITRSGNSTATTVTGVGFAPDLVFEAARTNSGGNNWVWFDRLRGGAQILSSDNSGAEVTNSVVIQSDSLSTTMDGFRIQTANPINASGNTYVYYPLKRAPGFFDEVCYTGTGSATTVSHNLGVTPEMVVIKRRNGAAENWYVYHAALGAGNFINLDLTAIPTSSNQAWNNTAPTASVFTVGTLGGVNSSSNTFVAYLFATCPGVSKVGSYTGTGALQTINCGFTGGARFVLIKRTDSTGDWYVYDSARGISSGNDPYLLLNSTAAEVTGTNYVDTTSVGFQVTAAAPAGLNANGGTYIFLAIA